MAKKLQLQIPEPCHEDWNKMTPVDEGRFCDSCQKAVIDFTGMSDTQLVAFFKKPSTGSVCGRFFDDQLERDFEIPRKRIPWLKYFFQFTIPVFLTSLKAQSQGNLTLKERTTPTTFLDIQQALSGKVGGLVIIADQKKLSGRVVDEQGAGVPFASVVINETSEGVMCDSTGFFELQTKTSEKKIFITASCVGYSSVEKQINTRKDNSLVITLATNAVLNGEVLVYTRSNVILGALRSVCVVKRSYLQKVKDYILKDSVKVYPNPAKAGNEIRIEWKKAEQGEYSIDLNSLQGQLIRSSIMKIDCELNVFSFQIPIVTPGSYTLRMTNKRTGRKHSEKIIIQ